MEQRAGAGRRVAFFGGSFDPPHLGHVAVARAARDALGLDTVLFAPVGAQPLKPHGATAAFEDRVAMTRLAIADEPAFAVSLADAPRPGNAPNYTLDTLRALRAALPPDGALFCLMGADSFLGLRKWHGAAQIPFAAALIVASRPGQQIESLRAALPAGICVAPAEEMAERRPKTKDGLVEVYRLSDPRGVTAPFYILRGLDVDISASQARKLMRELAGASSAVDSGSVQLLPPAVLDYIRAHGLYR